MTNSAFARDNSVRFNMTRSALCLFAIDIRKEKKKDSVGSNDTASMIKVSSKRRIEKNTKLLLSW